MDKILGVFDEAGTLLVVFYGHGAEEQANGYAWAYSRRNGALPLVREVEVTNLLHLLNTYLIQRSN